MLKIYDTSHNAIGHIYKYKDLKIESDVKTGDQTLSFTYMARHHEICEEYYVETQDAEYVIKEKSVSTDGFLSFTAVLNLEELEAKPWTTFSVKDSTIADAARLALAGSGWTVGESTVTKKRNAGIIQTNTLGIIQKLCTAFMCEVVYDTKKKTVSFYEEVGQDKGTFFLTGLNLKRLERKSSSYDYYTRIIPIGQNGLTIESVNNGKNYLENYQYTGKVKTYIWKDESYTDAAALKEDAQAKLKDLSKPEVSYSADIINLAKQKAVYHDFSFALGDTITLIDAATGIREKQRIIKLTQYPQNPAKDECELANKIPSFEETQEKLRAAQEIINTLVDDEGRYTGTISVSDILHFDDGVAGSEAVGSLSAGLSEVKLTVGLIETNYIKTEEAELKFATIESLKTTNAEVGNIKGKYAEFESTVTDELAANKAMIDDLESDYGDFKRLSTDKFSAQEAAITELESDYGDFKKLTADDFSAQDAAIKNLEVNKLDAHEASITYAQIESLEAAEARIETLEAGKVIADELIAKKADIDLANVNNAWIQNGILIDGSIGEAAIHDGAITNAKIADATIEAAKIKSINADTIDAGTIKTERLIITGPDGQDSIVKAINMANGVAEAEVNSEKIQAASIEVIDLAAFEAKIAGFDMSGNAIYSGKESIKDPNSGIYISTTGIGMGDGRLIGRNESPLQAYADGSFSLVGKNSSFDFNTVTGELNIEATSLKISAKSVATKEELDQVRDEISTLLRIESSRGTIFKNDQVATVLSAVIYHGKKRITDFKTMQETFGSQAYLQWKWQRLDDDSFGVISSSDSRFRDKGFTFTLSPEDVDTKVTFMCELIV